MIGHIEGQLLEVYDNVILVAVGGVGYELEVTHNVLATLPGRGKGLKLFTHFVVREDLQQLYGFASRAERDLFRVLIRASGMGPRLGVTLLSTVSPAELAASVRDGDADVLMRVPGIGRKKAERLLLELEGKLPASLEAAPVRSSTAASRAVTDAEGALVSLGYRPAEAAQLIQSARASAGSADAATVEALVRAALRQVAGQAEPAS
jgi:holliday junction DNA helicase RuvA